MCEQRFPGTKVQMPCCAGAVSDALMTDDCVHHHRLLLLLRCAASLLAHLSRHCAGVRPTMGAMVRHCVGMSLARCSSFSSSSRVHSVFLMLGSNHSYLQTSRCRVHLETLSCQAVLLQVPGLEGRAGPLLETPVATELLSCCTVSRMMHDTALRGGAPHHLALHCFADLRTSSDEMRDHWLSPYFITAALRISSCTHHGHTHKVSA